MNTHDPNDTDLKAAVADILQYFVKEGVAVEVAPGEFTLTEEGKELADIDDLT
jgi:predicted methyltransferase